MPQVQFRIIVFDETELIIFGSQGLTIDCKSSFCLEPHNIPGIVHGDWFESQKESDAASPCDSVISCRGYYSCMVLGVICFVKCYSGMSSGDTHI